MESVTLLRGFSMFSEYKTYRAGQTKRDRLSVHEHLGQSQAPYVLCKMTPCISLHLGAVILSKHEVGITIRENAATASCQFACCDSACYDMPCYHL